MDFSDLQLLPPANWEKFEELCLDVYRQQWGDPEAQKNGRRGQAQNGTDISGRPRYAPGELHGVQCKGKDTLYGGVVTKKELEKEVKKALRFQPRLSSWTLVTTAPKDAFIEKEARLISHRHQSVGLFRVTVLGWEDLRGHIADSVNVMEKHYPDQAPRQREILALLANIDANVATHSSTATIVEHEQRSFQANTTDTLGKILLQLQSVGATGPMAASPAEAILQARIDDAKSLIGAQQPVSALRQLDRIVAESWANAPDWIRFRLLANKAVALLSLGRHDEGAQTGLRAFSLAHEDHRAIVLAAQAHFLLGNVDEARAMLGPVLKSDPQNEDAQALRIAVSVSEDTVDDPYWIVPNLETAAWHVQLSAARWFRSRDRHEESLTAFRKALQHQPDQLEVMADTATCILEHLFGDKATAFAHQLQPAQRDDLQLAIGLLKRVWDSVKHTEVRYNYTWALSNFCSALRYLSNYEQSLEQLSEALVLCPDSIDLLQQRVLIEAATEKHDQVLRTLDRINSSQPEARLMRVDALEALNRHEEALAALNGFPDDTSVRLRLAAAGSRVKLLNALDRREEAQACAEGTVAIFPYSALARLILSEVSHKIGRTDEALEHARAAVGLIDRSPENDGLEGLIVAESLARLEDWDSAADLLTGVGDPREDSKPLRLRVWVLLNAGRRQELRKLLSAMPSEIVSLPVFARTAAWLYRLSGDYPAARAHLETYLTQVADDLAMRMLWLDVVERQGDTSATEEFLSSDIEHFRAGGRTQDLIALAQFMARHGQSERAVDLGYHILRERWLNPKAHLGYFGLLMMTKDVRTAIPNPTCIAVDVAFTVEDDVGHRRTYVIQTATDLKTELNEIEPGSRLSLTAMGLTVGNWLRVNDNDITPQQRIVELAHKYVSLLHRSLRDFNGLFPDNNSLIGLNVDHAHPERLIESLKPGLVARAAALREMLRQYQTTLLPIAFAARAIGLDPIDGWNAIRQGDIAIDVCEGIKPEQDKAVRYLKSRPLLILEPTTFWIAGVLGVLDALTATFGQLGLTATSIELLDSREREARDHLGRGRGVMFEHDGKVIVIEPTDADKRAPAELASTLLVWARAHAVVIPAIPEKDMGADARRLGELTHPSILDTLVAASGSGRVLLCEDRRLRLLAESVGVSKSVWLQSALLVCLEAHNLTRTAYSDALLDLALWGHSLTSLDSSAMVRASVRGGVDSKALFERVCARLASPNLELKSLLIVLAAFLAELWCQSRARAVKEQFTSIVLANCIQSHPDCPDHLAASFGRVVRGRERKLEDLQARQLRQAKRYIEQWIVAYGRHG